MKIVSIICLLIITVTAASSNDRLKLTAENLTLLAVKNSPTKKINDYTFFLVKTENSSEYYSVRNNSEKLNKLIEKKNKKLLADLAKISNKSHFTFSQKVSYEKYDEKKALLTIRNFLKGTTKSIIRKNHINDGLPDHFNLLFANMEILKDIKVDPNKFKELLAERKTTNKPSKELYIDVTVVLPKYQNEKSFQTVIKNINIYASKAKKLLVATRKETQKIDSITKNWLLSEGITSKLIGIHAFSFFGYRLQDMMLNAAKLKNFCKKTIRIGGHQTIVCKKPFSDNSTLIITYIGGVVAQLDLIATGALTFDEKKRLSKNIMMQLDKPKSIFQKHNEKWNKYKVDFTFYSDAFFGKRSTESQYHFSYNKIDEPISTNSTLIVSMMAQATKKFIEENK